MLYMCAYSHALSLLYAWLSLYLHVLSAGVVLGGTVQSHIYNVSGNKDTQQYAMQSSPNVFLTQARPTKLRNIWTSEIFTRTKTSNRLDLLSALKSNVFFNVGSKRSPPLLQREFVFDQDDRLAVDASKIKEYPYSNIVRLSGSRVGCTGTLIAPTYVLTAAHCLHDGDTFKFGMESLRIYIPDSHGYQTRYVRKVSVPPQWFKTGPNSNNSKRAKYDYAVLLLNIAISGRYEFMPLHVPNKHLLTEDLYFLGFLYDTESMSKSKCSESLKYLALDNNVLLSRCDSSVGNSGATLFHENPRAKERRKIIGVVSHTAEIKLRDKWTPLTSITLLTTRKIKDICGMMSGEGRVYNRCPPFPVRKLTRKALFW